MRNIIYDIRVKKYWSDYYPIVEESSILKYIVLQEYLQHKLFMVMLSIWIDTSYEIKMIQSLADIMTK